MTRPGSRALQLTLASLLVWAAWEAIHPFRHPWGDLSRGNYSDHFSHLNAARLFPRVGLDLWRRSEKAMFRPVTPDELAALPADAQLGAVQATETLKPRDTILLVPGWPDGKPLISSWVHNPRLYPPGDLLLVAPVALLYHFTSLSLSGACRLLLLLFLAAAHLALLVLFATWLPAPPATPALRALRAVALAWVYLEVIHWTLEGFYDAAALAPLLLCARMLQQRRGLPALAAYCAAVFLHFRALFFAPWAVEALVLALRQGELRTLRPRGLAGLLLSGALGLATLFVFSLLWPTLQRLPIGNPINPWGPAFLWWALALVGVLFAAVAGLLLRARATRELLTLGWLALMILQLREAYPWHTVLAVLPWLGSPLPGAGPGEDRLVLGARLLFVAGVLPVFGFEPLAVWKLW